MCIRYAVVTISAKSYFAHSHTAVAMSVLIYCYAANCVKICLPGMDL